MLAALIPYSFAAAGAFAFAVIYFSLRDAMRKAPLLARQIERIEQ